MRLNIGHKTTRALIFSLVLIVSVVGFNVKAESDQVSSDISIILDNYEKYQGEKIFLNDQKTDLKGEWGRLELIPFIFEPTGDFIIKQTNYNDIIGIFKSSGQWIFKNASLEEIRSLFESSGIKNETCNELLMNTSEMDNGKGYVTTPPESVIYSLTPELKANLYPLIGKYGDNYMYSQPLYFYSDNAKEWFLNSSLKKDVVDKILSLVYIKNGISYFSDVNLVIPYLKNNEDKISFLKTMYRTKALDAMLVVGEGQSVCNMAKYWGSMGRTSEIELLLKELSNQPGGGKINIANLLPKIPKDRLNTYSGIDEYLTDWKDCHWTTINFFNNRVDERYYDSSNLFSFIEGISKPSNGSGLKFGDIIAVFDENNELVHSCTYIAGNLTVTKNGMGNIRPFVLSYLDKTVSLYGSKTVRLTRTITDTYSVKS